MIGLPIDADQISRQRLANFKGRLQRLFLGALKGKEILQWLGFTNDQLCRQISYNL
jgi:hypothetical protein